jgi:hypothetical protein
MEITTKYDVGQRVFIRDWFDQKARIVTIKVTGPHRTISYEVEYWISDGVKSSTLYEHELSDVQTMREIGVGKLKSRSES